MSASDDPRLGDHLDAWLERRRSHVRPSTLAGYRKVVRNYLRPRLGRARLSEIDRRGIERVYARLLASGRRDGGPLSAGTIEKVHSVLRNALEDACLDGLLDSNPVEHVSPPRPHAGAVEIDDDLHVWTFDQAARFLAAVDHRPLRAVWHLALGTGARRGEVLGVRWKDLDLEGGTVTVSRALSVVDGTARLLRTKTSRIRRLSIGPSVVDALHRRRGDQQTDRARAGDAWDNRWDLAFTTPSGRYLHPGSFSARFAELVRSLDVPTIRLHDLRHTHASRLLELGVPIKVISERLGHASITTTLDTYAHLLPAMDRSAAETFADILRAAEE